MRVRVGKLESGRMLEQGHMLEQAHKLGEGHMVEQARKVGLARKLGLAHRLGQARKQVEVDNKRVLVAGKLARCRMAELVGNHLVDNNLVWFDTHLPVPFVSAPVVGHVLLSYFRN